MAHGRCNRWSSPADGAKNHKLTLRTSLWRPDVIFNFVCFPLNYYTFSNMFVLKRQCLMYFKRYLHHIVVSCLSNVQCKLLLLLRLLRFPLDAFDAAFRCSTETR